MTFPISSTAPDCTIHFALRELEVVLDGYPEDQRELLAHLVNHADEQFVPRSAVYFRLTRTGERGREVFETDGAGLKKVCCDEVALGYILYRMSTRLLMLYSGRTAVHCAAASIGGRLVLFTGDRGSGKTTLLIRLLLDGADFHCDEMVLAHDGVATTLPRRLHVKEGTLACIPEVAEVCDDKPLLKYGKGARFYAVDPMELGRAWHSASQRPAAIFQLQPEFDRPPEVTATSQIEMVKALMCQTLSGHRDFSRQAADITSLVRGVPCFRLRVGHLEQSADVIRRTVATL